MITFNQSSYISEAVRSILDQKVSFTFELIIADDASSDTTSSIIESIVKSHDKGYCIKYYKHGKNKGMMDNLIWALQKCSGKYIAMCEGDDYWINNDKLQKQISFLDENDQYIACYHLVNVVGSEGHESNNKMGSVKFEADSCGLFDLLLYGNFIYLSSFVFRNRGLSIPEFFSKLKIGDYYLYILLAQCGSFKFLEFYGSAYRIGVGTFSGVTHKKRRFAIKSSLRVAASGFKQTIISKFLLLRFAEDKLYRKNSAVTTPILKSKFLFFLRLDYKQVAKAIVKLIFATEDKRLLQHEHNGRS